MRQLVSTIRHISRVRERRDPLDESYSQIERSTSSSFIKERGLSVGDGNKACDMSSQRNTPQAFTNRKRWRDVAAFRGRITYGTLAVMVCRAHPSRTPRRP